MRIVNFAVLLVFLSVIRTAKLCKGVMGAKKFNPAAGRNKVPILEKLQTKLEEIRGRLSILRVADIASGTGEHASHFAKCIPNLEIIPVEPDESMHGSILEWASSDDFADGSSVTAPLKHDIRKLSMVMLPESPVSRRRMIDAVICINMIHISEYECTEALFKFANSCGTECKRVFTYGPYKENGKMVESNAAFHSALVHRNEEWGVRDIERVVSTAEEHGFVLEAREEMPANNLFLSFARREGSS